MPEVVLGACRAKGVISNDTPPPPLARHGLPELLEAVLPASRLGMGQHKGERPAMRLRAFQTPLRAHRPWVLGCGPVEVRREVR